jgi:hypothetical protein
MKDYLLNNVYEISLMDIAMVGFVLAVVLMACVMMDLWKVRIPKWLRIFFNPMLIIAFLVGISMALTKTDVGSYILVITTFALFVFLHVYVFSHTFRNGLKRLSA